MAAPPARSEISAAYPNPSNAVARVGFGKFFDYVTGLLGLTGNAAEARSALDVPGADNITTVGFEGGDFTKPYMWRDLEDEDDGAYLAPLESPDFEGNPTATTQAASDNSTRLATTAWAKVGMIVSFGETGYLKLPTWMGGLILQWGSSVGTLGASSNRAITFPVTFTAGYTAVATNGDASAGNEPTTVANRTNSGLNIIFVGASTGVTRRGNWFAVGV